MKTALITGGSLRIGAQITKTLHNNNYNVVIHYRKSGQAAKSLSEKLNKTRENSASVIKADLTNIVDIEKLSQTIGVVDILVNNAAVFYPTPIDNFDKNKWNEIINTNLLAPFLLSQKLAKKLAKNSGCIINIVDIHSQRPLKNYSIYNISKAGSAMMIKTLAKDLAPDVRVNGVSPGSILWPEDKSKLSVEQKNKMLNKIALKKQGSANDIANTVLFLIKSEYITGQIITVDGGRTLNQ